MYRILKEEYLTLKTSFQNHIYPNCTVIVYLEETIYFDILGRGIGHILSLEREILLN